MAYHLFQNRARVTALDLVQTTFDSIGLYDHYRTKIIIEFKNMQAYCCRLDFKSRL